MAVASGAALAVLTAWLPALRRARPVLVVTRCLLLRPDRPPAARDPARVLLVAP